MVVVVAGDAGGAAALVPVITTLISDGRVAVHTVAYGPACDTWSVRGIRIDEDAELSQVDPEHRLADTQAALLLVGTSLNAVMLEQRFVRVARTMGVPSVAVLDSWVNYVERFLDESGQAFTVPDRIAVMDEHARAEMIQQGIADALLVVTGQPAFDDVLAHRDGFTADRRRHIRDVWGATDDDSVVLFASQPLSELYGADPGGARHFGYDEQQVARRLIGALERAARDAGRSVMLVLRPHPREDPAWMRALTGADIRVTVSDNGSARDAALAAELVAGMSSALLIEACYMQCVVISLQPGLRREDVLPTNRMRYTQPVYHDSDIEPTVKRLLFDQGFRAALIERLRGISLPGGAARRVVDLLYRALDTHPTAI